MGFSLLDMIKQPAEQEGHIKRIAIDKIEPSKQNFYDVSEIAELKASMRMFGDVQIAIVSPIEGTDKYRLISGHRRLLAHLELMTEGAEGFGDMLCYIREGDPDNGDIASRLLLILTNSTARNLSDYERAQQTVQLKRLLIEYKEAGNEVPGSLRKYVAEALGISETQVQRYETIDKNLRQEIKEAFASDEISVSVAAELATEEPDQQMELFEDLQERGEVSVKAAREAKAQKRQQPEPIEQEIIIQNIDQKMYSQIIRHERAFIISKDTGQQVGQIIKFTECDKDYKPMGQTIRAIITVIDKMPGNDAWIVLGFRR